MISEMEGDGCPGGIRTSSSGIKSRCADHYTTGQLKNAAYYSTSPLSRILQRRVTTLVKVARRGGQKPSVRP